MRRPGIRCAALAVGLPVLATMVGALALAGPPARAAEPDPALALDGLHARGGDGWTALNSFHLDWTRAPGTPRPRIDAVDYLVRDASGAVVVPTVRNETVVTYIADLRVPPEPGEYSVEVWLEGGGRIGPRAATTLRFDDAPPPQASLELPGGWLGADQAAPVRVGPASESWPLSGLRGFILAVEGGTELELPTGADPVSLADLPEGVIDVWVRLVSGAGVRSDLATDGVLRIDRSAPVVTLGPLPSGWARGPVAVSASARDELSGMAAAGPAGPRTALLLDGERSVVSAGAEVVAVVHGDGVHRMLASARDAVGNRSQSPSERSAGVLRIDETPPRIAFVAAQDPADPERIEAALSDALSGPNPGRGWIGVRRSGSRRAFAPIPTRVSRGHLVAEWDSEAYPPGTYEFNATGFDAAGNRADSVQRSGGAPMQVVNPVKEQTLLVAGFGARKALVQHCERSRERVRCRREAAGPFARRPPRRACRYGQRVLVGGRLSSRSGEPLAGRALTVVETFAAGANPARHERVVMTAANGAFLVRLGPGPSRRVEISFAGTPLLGHSHGRALHLAVRAPVRMRASAPIATVGGAPVLFSGSVAPPGATIPSSGLPVGLEFRVGRGPWTEFRTVQTDARGSFRLPYSFSDEDSRGVRFQFRAQLGRQPGWPYAPGTSLPVVVTGR